VKPVIIDFFKAYAVSFFIFLLWAMLFRQM